jgi:transposase
LYPYYSVNIDISRNVIEYQAQVLQDENGKQFVAPFPDDVIKAVQYGKTLKAHVVYMSLYQLLPYKRVAEYFTEQLQIPISQGSLFNFNKEAFKNLSGYGQAASVVRRDLKYFVVCVAIYQLAENME